MWFLKKKITIKLHYLLILSIFADRIINDILYFVQNLVCVLRTKIMCNPIMRGLWSNYMFGETICKYYYTI